MQILFQNLSHYYQKKKYVSYKNWMANFALINMICLPLLRRKSSKKGVLINFLYSLYIGMSTATASLLSQKINEYILLEIKASTDYSLDS